MFHCGTRPTTQHRTRHYHAASGPLILEDKPLGSGALKEEAETRGPQHQDPSQARASGTQLTPPTSPSVPIQDGSSGPQGANLSPSSNAAIPSNSTDCRNLSLEVTHIQNNPFKQHDQFSSDCKNSTTKKELAQSLSLSLVLAGQHPSSVLLPWSGESPGTRSMLSRL